MLKTLLLIAALVTPLTITHIEPTKLPSDVVKVAKQLSTDYKRDPVEMVMLVEAVNFASSYFNLPKHVVMGLVAVESSFLRTAVSKKNACGYMQVTKQSGVMPLECFDTEQNIIAGATLLADYRDKYGLNKAIESYNAGPKGHAKEYRKKVLTAAKNFI